MWYYAVGETPVGPVDVATLRALLTSGTINTSTNVWKDGMPNWVTLGSVPELTMLASSGAPAGFPAESPTGSPFDSFAASAGSMRRDLPPAQKLRSLYTWYLVLSIISIPLLFVGIGLFTLIAAIVVGYILMYNCWKVVPTNIARTTPGKAVGFSFIPIFHLYWMFVAVYGLGKDLNKALAQRGVRQPVVNEEMLLAALIMIFIPYIGMMSYILLFISWNQMKDAACMLVEK